MDDATPKHCFSCKQMTADFARTAVYYCRPCVSARNKAYRAKNLERLKREGKARREANREQLAAAAKEYRRKNAEMVREKERLRAPTRREYKKAYQKAYRENFPEKANESVANWRKRNPDRIRARNERYRARKMGAKIGVVTPEGIQDRWAMWGDLCWVCGDTATATDHVKPLAKGGPHMLANLRPICSSCNSSKGAKWPLEAVS